MTKRNTKKRLTNVELVTNIMEFSKYGALSQLFVMDALQKLANAVAKSKPEDYGANPFVHPQAWIGVAKEIAEKLKGDQ
jgi:hypothetical protein